MRPPQTHRVARRAECVNSVRGGDSLARGSSLEPAALATSSHARGTPGAAVALAAKKHTLVPRACTTREHIEAAARNVNAMASVGMVKVKMALAADRG